MSKRTVQEQLSIPESAVSQIRGFTAQSSRGIYAGAVRRSAAALGYPLSPITLTDPNVLARIDAHALDVAVSIQQTYNRMLSSELAKLPDGLSDATYRRSVQPFLDGVTKHNNKDLIPLTSRTMQGQAVKDFYRENGIVVPWNCEPSKTAGCDDECDEAVGASPMTQEEADRTEMPAHNGCPHLMVPGTPDPSTLPDTLLWIGGDL